MWAWGSARPSSRWRPFAHRQRANVAFVVASRTKRIIEWLLLDRTTGRITIVQFPNVPLGIFLIASALRWFASPDGTTGTVVSVVATGGLLWWAIDEIVRGVNPFRRALGASIFVVTVVMMFVRL